MCSGLLTRDKYCQMDLAVGGWDIVVSLGMSKYLLRFMTSIL
jgi:hypothetical protein